MLHRIAKKAYSEAVASAQDGSQHAIKMLNFSSAGVKLWRYDCKFNADDLSAVLPGMTLTLPAYFPIIVSNKTPNYYRGKVIRYEFEAVECNNEVTISRSVLTKTAQGGLSGKTDTELYADVPCKLGLAISMQDTRLDQDIERFMMLIPSTLVLQKGDNLSFKSVYKDAKIDGLTLVTPGLIEIRFDTDPRR